MLGLTIDRTSRADFTRTKGSSGHSALGTSGSSTSTTRTPTTTATTLCQAIYLKNELCDAEAKIITSSTSLSSSSFSSSSSLASSLFAVYIR